MMLLNNGLLGDRQNIIYIFQLIGKRYLSSGISL